MAKVKITRKEIKARHTDVIAIGYCTAHNLLRYEDAWAYNAGVNGWNYDVYSIGTTAITTGYNPIGRHIDYEIVKAYDEKAEAIAENRAMNYDEKKEAVRELLYKFIKEA